jgi:hypothetical protein
LLNLSVNPVKRVLPPVTITLLNSKGRKSISQEVILLNTSLETPTECRSWFGDIPNEGIFSFSFPCSTGG